MAKIVIAGDAVVVKSELKLEDIKTIEKYNAKARWDHRVFPAVRGQEDPEEIPDR